MNYLLTPPKCTLFYIGTLLELLAHIFVEGGCVFIMRVPPYYVPGGRHHTFVAEFMPRPYESKSLSFREIIAYKKVESDKLRR